MKSFSILLLIVWITVTQCTSIKQSYIASTSVGQYIPIDSTEIKKEQVREWEKKMERWKNVTTLVILVIVIHFLPIDY